MSQIDSSALTIAREGGDLTPVFDRLQIMTEILDYHARGEEAAIFPAVDHIAPLVAEAYVIDHRELDNMVQGLEVIRKTPDPLITARATAVLNSHLRIHLDKEDKHLYPILREKTTDEEQIAIGRMLSSRTPPERISVQIQWLFLLLDFEDQVTVTRIFLSMMPPPVFAKFKPLIKRSVSANWAFLTQRIPELAEK
jgi:hypothetical protein